MGITLFPVEPFCEQAGETMEHMVTDTERNYPGCAISVLLPPSQHTILVLDQCIYWCCSLVTFGTSSHNPKLVP
jgi:hypothetical protein